MPALKNVRHEAFAQAFARGGVASKAYMGVYTNARPNCAQAAGSRLSRRPNVVARVEELRREIPKLDTPEPKLDVMDNTPTLGGHNNGPNDHDKVSVDQNKGPVDLNNGDMSGPQADAPAAGEVTTETASPPATVLEAEVVDCEPAPATLTPGELQDVFTRWGRAQKLVHLWNKLLTVVFERARDPQMQDVPGGRTGMMTLTYRTVTDGETKRVVKETRVDTALVDQLQGLLEQTARELGQLYEHRTLTETETAPALREGAPDLSGLSLEDLETLRQLYDKARQATTARLAPPA